MTTKKPVHKFTRDGTRLYLNPESREKVPSVTAITDNLPKPWLQFWSNKIVAQCAIDNLDTLPMLLENNGRQGVEDFLKKAPSRNTADAASMGSTVHAMFESFLQTGESEIPFDAESDDPDERERYVIADQYADQIINFIETVEPDVLYTEETVWSETHGYAGSFDGAVKIKAYPQLLELLGLSKRKKTLTAMLDLKTSRSGIHPEVALQISGYVNADYIVRGDAEKLKLPDFDVGLVLHMRPEGWKLYPVALHDEVFATFLALKQVQDWDKKIKKQALGDPVDQGEAF